MQVIPLASGSSGNCYIIKSDGPVFLLEAGLTFSEIQKGFWKNNLKLSDITVCLISHFHQDHSKAAQKLSQRGIEIFTEVDVARTLNLEQPKTVFSQESEGYTCLSALKYAIWPFKVPHGDVKNYAYLIEAGEGELLFYATDCSHIPVVPKNVSTLMIECNYVEEKLDQATLKGESSLAHAKKSIRSHLSLETLLDYLDKLDQSKLRKIYLLHLSNEFSNPAECKERVQRATGVEVYLA